MLLLSKGRRLLSKGRRLLSKGGGSLQAKPAELERLCSCAWGGEDDLLRCCSVAVLEKSILHRKYFCIIYYIYIILIQASTLTSAIAIWELQHCNAATALWGERFCGYEKFFVTLQGISKSICYVKDNSSRYGDNGSLPQRERLYIPDGYGQWQGK